MKKIFYLLFISSIVLASCEKDEPVEPLQVTCDCGDSLNGTNSSNSTVDPNLVGHWKVENVTNQSTATSYSDATTIHLYFFSNGYMCAAADYTYNGSQITGRVTNNFITLDGNKIRLDQGVVLNYSISNNTLTFYEETGQSPSGLIFSDNVYLFFGATTPANSTGSIYYHLNNLIKQ